MATDYPAPPFGLQSKFQGAQKDNPARPAERQRFACAGMKRELVRCAEARRVLIHGGGFD